VASWSSNLGFLKAIPRLAFPLFLHHIM
jgi:hypothetical protein